MLEMNATAVIVHHCAIMGDRRDVVRWFKVCEPKPYAHYDLAGFVWTKKLRKRRAVGYHIFPTNLTYLTIEVTGEVVTTAERKFRAIWRNGKPRGSDSRTVRCSPKCETA